MADATLRARARPALAILALAAATIAGAWTFQALGYAPCELCLEQRYAYYAGVPVAALTLWAAARGQGRLATLGFVALALLFAANSVLAGYHSGVELKLWAGPSACTGAITGPADVKDLLQQLDTVQVVRCDEVNLRVFGLSLASWNVLVSAAIALASGYWARAGSRARA